jgi:hypothetical protein
MAQGVKELRPGIKCPRCGSRKLKRWCDLGSYFYAKCKRCGFKEPCVSLVQILHGYGEYLWGIKYKNTQWR